MQCHLRRDVRRESRAFGAVAPPPLPIGARYAISLISLISGCVTGPGGNWGEVAVTAVARFAPPAGRLTPAGALLTPGGYEISIDQLGVQVEGIALALSAADAPPSFDPAKPPAGYTLCHNGHCHGTDGSLRTYAEVASGLETQTAQVIHVEAADVTTFVAASASGVAVQLAPCGPTCELPYGRVVRVEAHVTALHIVGSVRSPGGVAGLSHGLPFDVTVPRLWVVSRPVDIPFDRSHPPFVALDVALSVPTTLLDEVNFAAGVVDGVLLLPAAATEAVGRAFSEAATLAVHISRSAAATAATHE